MNRVVVRVGDINVVVRIDAQSVGIRAGIGEKGADAIRSEFLDGVVIERDEKISCAIECESARLRGEGRERAEVIASAIELFDFG